MTAVTNTFNSGTDPKIVSLLDTLSTMLGVSINLANSKSFIALVESNDGKSVNFTVRPRDNSSPNAPSSEVGSESGGFAAKSYGIPSGLITDPASGSADLDGAVGTATLVGSTVTVTVPAPADGGVAVPVGSTILATVVTSGGKPKLLSAVRASATQITISSPGVGYGALLESAGVVSPAMTAGVVTVTLANVAGDRLAAENKTPGGTPGACYSCQSAGGGTQVLVNSQTAAGALQVLDTSTVTVYNFGQSADETSTVNWAVIRP